MSWVAYTCKKKITETIKKIIIPNKVLTSFKSIVIDSNKWSSAPCKGTTKMENVQVTLQNEEKLFHCEKSIANAKFI